MTPTKYEVPPKLPVPSMKDCFGAYLDDLSAIIPQEEWQKTRALVEEFTAKDGLGPILHQKLEELSERVDNWAHDFWLDDMYFRVGLALPVNSNPGMVLRKQNFTSDSEWLRFAAEVVYGAVEYKLLIDSENVPQNYTRQHDPLDMQQYHNIFSTYRRPGLIKDQRLRFSGTEHCVVVTKGQFFQLNLFDEGDICTPAALASELTWIVDHAEDDPQLPVGLLTTMARREWGQVHRMLVADESNEKSLAMIESSLFLLCLDDECQVMSDIDVNEETTTLHEMIHGGGSTAHSRNRWFEKPLQLIVNRQGFCGLNYEHSSAEGIPVVAMIESAYKRAQTWKKNQEMEKQGGRHPKMTRRESTISLGNGRTHSTTSNGLNDGQTIDGIQEESIDGIQEEEQGDDVFEETSPKHLKWNLSNELLTILDDTCHDIDRLAGDLELRVYRFDLFGKNVPKQFKMSPDCFVQLALQLAFYKSHDHLVATYESASIRRFAQGRVDVIRAATTEAKNWVEGMTLNGRSKEEMLKLFWDAMNKQTDVMNKAIRGQGMDNYFIALREIGTVLTGAVPVVFDDENFKYFNSFYLSTSQVPTSDEKTFMGYGPVIPGGYGCSYNLHEKQILFCISSWRSCTKTSTKLFSRNLDEGLLEMQELLQNTSP